jgi:hypothetical protein
MTLKIIAPLLTALGSLILAWRVKTILDVLIFAQRASEGNFRSITKFLSNKQSHLGMLVGMDEHVEKQQKNGLWLLVVGFLLIATGAGMNAYTAWVN